MTRAQVFQIGLIVFVLGGLGYEVFQLLGFESISAGIATQSILILIIFAWTASYLFRVFSGNMTFMEQRKRYRAAYEKLTDEKIREKFEAMTDEEKIELLKLILTVLRYQLILIQIQVTETLHIPSRLKQKQANLFETPVLLSKFKTPLFHSFLN